MLYMKQSLKTKTDMKVLKTAFSYLLVAKRLKCLAVSAEKMPSIQTFAKRLYYLLI